VEPTDPRGPQPEFPTDGAGVAEYNTALAAYNTAIVQYDTELIAWSNAMNAASSDPGFNRDTWMVQNPEPVRPEEPARPQVLVEYYAAVEAYMAQDTTAYEAAYQKYVDDLRAWNQSFGMDQIFNATGPVFTVFTDEDGTHDLGMYNNIPANIINAYYNSDALRQYLAGKGIKPSKTYFTKYRLTLSGNTLRLIGLWGGTENSKTYEFDSIEGARSASGVDNDYQEFRR